MRRVLVLLNGRAGLLLDRGADHWRQRAREALAAPGRELDVDIVAPAAMHAAIRRAATGGHEAVVIGGGDGSVSAAADALAGAGKVLGVLPFGTVNLFARDLGMPAEPEAALAALAQARPRTIDLGTVNGRHFHSLSGLGFFSQMARAREESRHLPGKLLRVGAAAWRALTRTGRYALDIETDGVPRRIDTYALLVTCNRFGGDDWRREALDGGTLEVHVARDEGALNRLKAGADLLTGDWRANPDILSWPARQVRVLGPRRRAFVATDGELKRLRLPLDYRIAPAALRVLVAG